MRLALALVLFLPLAAGAQPFRVVKLVEGLDHPWSLAFLPDDRMLVTERPGRLHLIGRDFSRSAIGGVPRVYASGQGGLLEVALHPRTPAERQPAGGSAGALRAGAEDHGRPALRRAHRVRSRRRCSARRFRAITMAR